LTAPAPARGDAGQGAWPARPHRAPWWLPGGHAQTIVPARLLAAPRVSYRRERWDTPDGDFIDVDFALAEPADPAAPLLMLFHGLEGGSQSHYARLVMHAGVQRGWRALVVHFRGCGGEPNRLLRAYHSGDSAEIDWILRLAARRWPLARRFAAGISLGGNALAKWAGERGAQAQELLCAAAAVCAPLDLSAGGHALGRGFNLVYARYFLATLRPKALAKAARFAGELDAARIAASRTLYDFDDAYTAPVHGFAGALDYWHRASAKPLLADVRMPLLLLNARNDPFVPAASLPLAAEVSAQVSLDQPPHGGHVGFFAQRAADMRWFLPARLFRWFEQGR
jgi:predicted alpha/beta-fold hydrolase